MDQNLTFALSFASACAGILALGLARYFWKLAPVRRRRGLAGGKADTSLASDAPVAPGRRWVDTPRA